LGKKSFLEWAMLQYKCVRPLLEILLFKRYF